MILKLCTTMALIYLCFVKVFGVEGCLPIAPGHMVLL